MIRSEEITRDYGVVANFGKVGRPGDTLAPFYKIYKLANGELLAGSIYYNYAYACGIYKSIDNGKTWSLKTPTVNFKSIIWSDFCVTKSGLVLASIMKCQNQDNTFSNYYLYKSDDNGNNWRMTGAYNWHACCLCALPSGRVLAGTDQYGIIYNDSDNTDQGFNSWPYTSITTGKCTSIVRMDNGVLFAAVKQNNSTQICKSVDDGLTWDVVLDNQNEAILQVINNTVFIGFDQPYSYTKCKYSDDMGQSWTEVTQPSSIGYIRTFAIVKETEHTLLLMTNAGLQRFDNRLKEFTDPITTLRTYYQGSYSYTDISLVSQSDTSDRYTIAIGNHDRLLLCKWTYNSAGFSESAANIKWSDVERNKCFREKYLDQNGAQEIVTQFQAYCDSLVGGGE